jgi:2-(1,2-epoxy-1,2-dihydrophenyl)acetyl-CoA isomerase
MGEAMSAGSDRVDARSAITPTITRDLGSDHTNQRSGEVSYETVIWEQSGGVGRLTLNRPETLNAWTAQFGSELRRVVEGEAAESSVRAVLITGAGRGFSSGADLKAGFDPAEDGMPNIRKELHEIYHPAIAGIRRLPKPVVAAVNGPAVGIGCSLALACDLIMASESAFFGLAFVNIGLMPNGSTRRGRSSGAW